MKDLLVKQTLQIDGESIVCESYLRDTNAIILHGAGTAERSRYYPIAEELMHGGVGVVLFDFSGHGESTGKLSELSLDRRKKQAIKVIESMVPSGDLSLIGFSMGAQTVCDLLSIYNKRTKAVLLGCPAIYTKSVKNLVFGDPKFTQSIRIARSWEESEAPQALKLFPGKIVIAIGSADEVIPKGVIELLQQAVPQATYVEYPEVTHKLAHWFGEHPQELHSLMQQLMT